MDTPPKGSPQNSEMLDAPAVAEAMADKRRWALDYADSFNIPRIPLGTPTWGTGYGGASKSLGDKLPNLPYTNFHSVIV